MRAVFHLLATFVKVVEPEDIRICTNHTCLEQQDHRQRKKFFYLYSANPC